MICIIRIKGRVGIERRVEETLSRLRLRKKYSCVIIEKPTKEQKGMIKKVKDFVAYGEISKDMHKKIEEKRKTKIKNFFRLHPPRKGINSKRHFPKGVLGDHGEKINDLVERML